MTYTEQATAMFDSGYTLTPIKKNAKRPLLYDWTTRELNRNQIITYADNGYGIGVVCGHGINGLDIDVTDPDTVNFVVEILESITGVDIMRRLGDAPKITIPFRHDDENQKLSGFNVKYADNNGDKQYVEIRQLGQQFVAYGVHPDTEEEYQWINGTIADVAMDDILTLSKDDLILFRDTYIDHVEALGWKPFKANKSTVSSTHITSEEAEFEASMKDTGILGLTPEEAKTLISLSEYDGIDNFYDICFGVHHEFGNSEHRDEMYQYVHKHFMRNERKHPTDPKAKYSKAEIDRVFSRPIHNDSSSAHGPITMKRLISRGVREHKKNKQIGKLDNEFQEVAARIAKEYKVPVGKDSVPVPTISSDGFRRASEMALNIKPPQSLIDGILSRDDHIQMIYARPNVGKTFVALSMGMAISRGVRWLGQYQAYQTPVLYVSPEGSEGNMSARLRGFQEQYDKQADENEDYIFDIKDSAALNLNDEEHFDAFVEAIIEREKHNGSRYGVIMLDTFAAVFRGMDENSAGDITRILSMITEKLVKIDGHKERIIFIVHHPGKSKSSTGRGSSAFEAYIDYVMHMRMEEDENGAPLVYQLVNDDEDDIIYINKITGIREKTRQGEVVSQLEIWTQDIRVGEPFIDELTGEERRIRAKKLATEYSYAKEGYYESKGTLGHHLDEELLDKLSHDINRDAMVKVRGFDFDHSDDWQQQDALRILVNHEAVTQNLTPLMREFLRSQDTPSIIDDATSDQWLSRRSPKSSMFLNLIMLYCDHAFKAVQSHNSKQAITSKRFEDDFFYRFSLPVREIIEVMKLQGSNSRRLDDWKSAAITAGYIIKDGETKNAIYYAGPRIKDALLGWGNMNGEFNDEDPFGFL